MDKIKYTLCPAEGAQVLCFEFVQCKVKDLICAQICDYTSSYSKNEAFEKLLSLFHIFCTSIELK